MKKSHFIFALLVAVMTSCNTNDPKDPSYDIVGTKWLWQEGTITSGTTILAYTYVKGTVLANGKTIGTVWKSTQELSISNTTVIENMGCQLLYTDSSYTYTYTYPTAQMYDNNSSLVGTATIANDHNTASFVPALQGNKPTTMYRLINE